jgi:NAD+ synthase (glutamine-hydrolysing)
MDLNELSMKTHYYRRHVKVAACTLNQWAMDFEGNKQRIIESLRQCVKEKANIRIGPEQEIPGYGCEDHFLEEDTVIHSWEVLADIINHQEDFTSHMLCDFGMPVNFHGIIFNCRVLVYQKKILLIRPKIANADDGNYRESRYFIAWTKGYQLEDFTIPSFLAYELKQQTCKFGVAIIQYNDLTYAPEICEELWIPYSPSIDLAMAGCLVIGNSSGSHFQIGKHQRRKELIEEASKKNGGLFIYSNMVGCDGGKLYFDGGSFVVLNGKLIANGRRFILEEVEVIFAIADLNEVISYRSGIKSRCIQSLQKEIKIQRIIVNDYLLKDNYNLFTNPFKEIESKQYTFIEEIQYAPSCWLWDYLRRSSASALFLPLSGGADSATVAMIVSLLCKHIYTRITEYKDEFVLNELRRIVNDVNYYPKSSKEICGLLFVTAFLETKHSTEINKCNSKQIADEIGSYHIEINIENIVNAFLDVFEQAFKRRPQCEKEGGSIIEDKQIKNLQGRIRMIMSYMIAGLIPYIQQRKHSFLLVLSSGNLDELITGFLTKYNSSSGDLNPIGSISKVRLRTFLEYCYNDLGFASIGNVLKAIPNEEHTISSLTYNELSLMGMLRKDYKCGPYSMFRRLMTIWLDKKKEDVLQKVKIFFQLYAKNRHKVTAITPSLHCESYSIDDSRYDLRPFLYNTSWKFQFNQIDNLINSKEVLRMSNI